MREVVIIWVLCSFITLGLANGHFRCVNTAEYLTEEDARRNFVIVYLYSLMFGPLGTSATLMYGGLATEHQLNYNFKPMTQEEARATCWTW